jgi:hypothetical protein
LAGGMAGGGQQDTNCMVVAISLVDDKLHGQQDGMLRRLPS